MGQHDVADGEPELQRRAPEVVLRVTAASPTRYEHPSQPSLMISPLSSSRFVMSATEPVRSPSLTENLLERGPKYDGEFVCTSDT